MPEETDEHVWDTVCPPECSSLVKCVFCQKDLIQKSEDILSAQLLLCFHSICSSCVESWKKGGSRTCPVCNIPLTKQLLDNKVLQECVEQPQADSFQKGVCDMHTNAPADRWCHDCRSLVCDFCIETHKNLISTRSHKIVDYNDVSLSSHVSLVNFACEEHNSMQLEIYCSTCNQMTCRDCQLENHKQHSYTFINDMCKDYKQELIVRRAEMSMSEKTLAASQKAIEELQKDLLRQKDELHANIDRVFKSLMDALKTRFLELKNQVDSLIDDDIKSMTEKMLFTSKVMEPVKHCIDVVDLLLHHSSDPTIIFSRKHLEKFFLILSNRSIELANPYVKRKVNFSMPNSQLPNLLNSIKGIGLFTNSTVESGTPVLASKATENPTNEKTPAGKAPQAPQVPQVDVPAPVRIQLRQDLQSTDPSRAMERIDTIKSPDSTGKPNWHTPEERPAASLPRPAALADALTLPSLNKPAPKHQLQDILQTNQLFVAPSKAPHLPGPQRNSAPSKPTNQRGNNSRNPPQPDARYPSGNPQPPAYPNATAVAGALFSSLRQQPDPAQQITTTANYSAYVQNSVPYTVATTYSKLTTIPGNRHHKDPASRQNPHFAAEPRPLTLDGTPPPSFLQPPMNPMSQFPNLVQQFASHPQVPVAQLAHQVPPRQDMLYFPGSTHNPYPSQ